MLFAADLPKPGYMPRISNGRIGIELFQGLNYGSEGMAYMTGVYNGFLNVTPSDAAAIPSPWLAHFDAEDNLVDDVEPIGGAMDIRRSMYRNLTLF